MTTTASGILPGGIQLVIAICSDQCETHDHGIVPHPQKQTQ
jgi:hypothetical protein